MRFNKNISMYLVILSTIVVYTFKAIYCVYNYSSTNYNSRWHKHNVFSALTLFQFISLFDDGCSYLHITAYISPPKRRASHRFFITANFKHSHCILASRFVCKVLPIPSMTIRSTLYLTIARHRSKSRRLLNIETNIYIYSITN